MIQAKSRRMKVWLLAAAVMALASACRRSDALIDQISVQPSSNLESVRIALVFNPRTVQSTLGGGFAIGEHGYLFLNPYSPPRAFEVGFELNTAIFGDPNYVDLQPTTVFPNGIPMRLPHAVVEVRPEQPIGKRFDVYAYVDVLHAQWLGSAVMLDFIDDRAFPPGLALSQVFRRDEQDRPTLMAAVFGPEVDSTGKITRSGGIAVLANVKSLLKQAEPGRVKVYRAEKEVVASGPEAKRYSGDLLRMHGLERNLIRGLNAPETSGGGRR